MKMYREAIKTLKQAVRIDPNHKSAYSNLGSCYFNPGLYRESVEVYKQAIRIDPDEADYHFFC